MLSHNIRLKNLKILKKIYFEVAIDIKLRALTHYKYL